MTDRCRLLEWDSEFFDCRIARLDGARLSQDQMEKVDRWCATERIDCLYFLADSRCPRDGRDGGAKRIWVQRPSHHV